MKTRILLFCIAFALLAAQASAQTNPSTTTSSSDAGQYYCQALFNNQIIGGSGTTSASGPTSNSGGVVSSVFATPGVSGVPVGLIGIALLAVIAMLVLIGAVYGFGRAFGINKLVDFAKVESIESFFNLILIMTIAAGIACVNGYALFFSNIAGAGGYTQLGTGSTSSVTIPTASSLLASNGMEGLYQGICSNIMDGYVIPNAFSFFRLFVIQPIYTFLQSTSLNVGLTIPVIGGFNAAIAPLAGLSIFYQLTIFEEAPLLVVIFLGIVMAFIFYVIYFLFPVFLYAGVILRALPWTRAAGGALLSVFIAFYIILPALYYPFSAVVYQMELNIVNNNQNSLMTADCTNLIGSPLSLSASELGSDCFPSASGGWLEAISGIGNALSATGSVITGGASQFQFVLDNFIATLAFAFMSLFTLAISLVISFDLLEALGDLLGSPSLQSHRILERLI